jgi:hypothetical protein
VAARPRGAWVAMSTEGKITCRELWFPKCPGCNEELFSDPKRGDVVVCKCGVVAECLDWQGKQFRVLEDRRGHREVAGKSGGANGSHPGRP